jgi:hypothetical protein
MRFCQHPLNFMNFVLQETVFASVGKRIIESAVAGYNGTIFA